MLNFLRETVGNPKYQKWNTNTVQMMVDMLSKYVEGTEERNLILKIFKGFVDWRKTQPADYLPKSGMEIMYSSEFMQELYDYALTNPPPSKEESFEEFKSVFFEKYNELYAKYPTRMATLTEMHKMSQEEDDDEPITLMGRFMDWGIKNPQSAVSIIFGFVFIIGVATGIGGCALYTRYAP